MNQGFRSSWFTLDAMGNKARSREWMSYVREIGDNFHRLRLEKGLGQEKLAYEAGLSRTTIQRLENPNQKTESSSNPTLVTLVSLCRVLDVDILDVLPQVPLPDPQADMVMFQPARGAAHPQVPAAKTVPKRR